MLMNETMTKLFRHDTLAHAPTWTQAGLTALGHWSMRVEIRVTVIVP